MMRKSHCVALFLLFSFALAFWLAADCLAANHYIRAGASGANDGTNWTDAWINLPSSLTRGDTYYIADGTYGSYTFDDAESGVALITIKKAIAADHGTDTGWQPSYGDGEALFQSSGGVWAFSTGYYIINGQVGSGKTGYGIRLYSTASRSSSTAMANASGAHDLTISFVEFDWDNGSAAGANAVTRTWGSWSASSNITFSHCYFHHSSGYVFYVGAYGGGTPQTNYIIEHCYFYMIGGGGGPSAHWEMIWSTEPYNWDFRYNTIENVYGSVDAQTGWYMIGTGGNIRIYGNLFFCSNPNFCAVGGNGVIATWSNDVYVNSNVYIYNNTFVDIAGGYGPKINFLHNSADDSNIVCRNNLYYNSSWSWSGVDTQSDEVCGGGQACAGTSQQSGLSTSMFLDYAGDNFHLASATSAGYILPYPYTVDMNENTRGSDGIWDRGAFEFSFSAPSSPEAGPPKSPTSPRTRSITP